MRKTYRHNETSSKLCDAPGCERHLKLNLLERVPDAKLCYEHWKEVRNKEKGKN